jgi:F-type H+-transporting ATPase subunit gamma
MATAREIRRRIRSVKNISQVTRALEAVSASKLRRAQAQVLATRAYAEASWRVLHHLAGQTAMGGEMHPLLAQRPEVAKVSIVLLTSDRGLCGAFNHNVIRTALDFIDQLGRPVELITVGRKGRDLMLRLGKEIVAEFTHLPDSPSFIEISPIAQTAIEDFLRGEVGEIFLAYTDFVNSLRQVPAVKRLLPLRPTELETQVAAEYVQDVVIEPVSDYLYEPSPEVILEAALPRFTQLQVYQATLESLASEHAARMVAMRNATENAEELVDDLTLSYNKARQQAITNEILDIAGGAEALAQSRNQRAR